MNHSLRFLGKYWMLFGRTSVREIRDALKNLVGRIIRLSAIESIQWMIQYERCGASVLQRRYECPQLNEDSIVFDLGAYKGEFVSRIALKYNPTIYAFEPSLSFYKELCQLYQGNNKKLKLFPFGLASKDSRETMIIEGDGSTIFHKERGLRYALLEGRLCPKEEVQLLSAGHFFKEHGITRIDLMKVNIEGGEYDLLDYLIERDWLQNIHELQVSFHRFVPNAEARMRRIQEALSKTHTPVEQCEYLLEIWRAR